ncbi:Probable methyltransferase PMT10, partial [Linum grandiflorum]
DGRSRIPKYGPRLLRIPRRTPVLLLCSLYLFESTLVCITTLHPTATAAMKPTTSAAAAAGTAIEIVKTPIFVKIAVISLLSFSILLLFYSHNPSIPSAISTFISSSFTNSTSTAVNSTSTSAPSNSSSTIINVNKLPPPSPPPQSVAKRTGIVDENGVMTEDFEVGEFDPNEVEDVGSSTSGAEEPEEPMRKLAKFQTCEESKIDYIPCLDKSERKCPNSRLNCVVPMPNGYQKSIPWPRSREEVLLHNIPDTTLVYDQGMYVKDDKIVFHDGGANSDFVNGVDQYLNWISQMLPDIDFGRRTRVALDFGSGIGSFAASLSRHNVTTLSIGPKDVHKNHIQFVLERGLPAMVAVFGTRRLPYSSQTFDLIHCSRSGIDWTANNGVLLLEVNRLLRAGRYFVWRAPKGDNQWKVVGMQLFAEIDDLTRRICWELVKKEGGVAIWRKPLNNSCYLGREIGAQPQLCSSYEDPDNVWYFNVSECITPLPEEGYGSNITLWPARLHYPPDRLKSIRLEASISRKELLRAESKYWHEIISSYVRAFHWKEQNFRNVIDMKAGFGGFAAALHDLDLASWVMNVVPVNGFNTLPVIYDRGLLGVMHDWCEPFDTYPRSYDLVHAAGLFSDEKKREKCEFSTILLEMDRILRPGGTAYIRDSLAVIDEIHEISNALGWVVRVHDTGEGPHSSWRFLACEKRMP